MEDRTTLELTDFIKDMINDSEFWISGGIPTNEEYYINKLGLSKKTSSFYL